MTNAHALFALGLLAALLVANAHWPRYRPPGLSVVSFFGQWLTAEPAAQHLGLLGLAVLALVCGGALTRPLGWAGLLLASLAAAGLAHLLWQGLGSRDTLAAALEQGSAPPLGPAEAPLPSGSQPGSAAETPAPDRPIAPGRGPEAEPAPARSGPAASLRAPLRDWWLPWPVRPRSVEKLADIPFTEAGEPPLALDLYRHRDRPPGCPVLLQVHGGGWVIGDKREQGLPLLFHLAERGWLCATANYRLSPGARVDEQVVDLKRALRWLRRHATDYGGDPTFLAVTGESAGGHLATLLALTAGDETLQPGFETVDTAVQAGVSFYGVYDLADRAGDWPHAGFRRLMQTHVVGAPVQAAPERYDRFSPLCRVHAAAPPLFVLHGTHDNLVPVAQARRFVAALRARSRAPVCYAELPGAGHAFDIFPSPRAAQAVRAVASFLEAARRRPAPRGEPLDEPV